MTRTLPIVFLLTLAAVAPLFAARALGSLETQASNAGACLDGPRVEVTPKAAAPQSGLCVAGDTADDGPEVRP